MGFDRIKTWTVYKAMANSGMGRGYVDLIKVCNREATATYVLHEKMRPVQLKRRVRENDSLSPKLSRLTLEEIYKEMDRGRKVS